MILKRDPRLEPIQGQALKLVYDGNLVRVQFRKKRRLALKDIVLAVLVGFIAAAIAWALAQ